ncbi:MAG: protein kinase domain-containing protein, partial [Gammaproteobacteria bacterium]
MAASKKHKHLNALKPGHRIHWYEITDILGVGGFGITYLAQDLNLEHEVAIKEYLPSELIMRDEIGCVHPLSPDHGTRYQWGLNRFLSEGRTIGKFKHPNIVRVRNVFEANNTAYMVMDYELGESLQEILGRRKTLSEEEIKNIILPIIDGVRLVHASGFIHRDIKPANIFIRVDGDPVLLDFGSARKSLQDSIQSLTSIFSRGYAPIEQYNTNEDIQGPWTDIYSLGATLYRIIAGVPPADAVDRSVSISHAQKDSYVPAMEIGENKYSEPLLRAIDHALQFRHKDRPQSIDEWIDDFSELWKEKTAREEPVYEGNGQAGPNRKSSFEITREEAVKGNVVAMSNLAFMYAKGIGTRKDEAQAVEWYQRAAEKGHLTSQYNLGVIYAKGRGVSQDYAESCKWYRKAAEQGDMTAQSTLAMMYAKGVGTEKNLKEAADWYHRAAAQGHVNSQYILANLYARGHGVPQDDAEAFEWYKQAAEKGHINAQVTLGYMYGKGSGTARDDLESFN